MALKVLPMNFCRSRDAVTRFAREARAAGQLRHPNIVEVFNIGEDRGFHYIEMEYVDGRALREILEERGRMAPADLVGVMEAACRAMEAAHREGIIHRDIKPDNVMIARDGALKITDFGLARGTEESLEVTREGQVLGTPHYMSPEQCRGEVLDARSDIYSLGVTFYHMATGKRPFSGESAVVILRKHIEEEPVTVERLAPDVPDGVCAIIGRMMAKTREERYGGMADAILDIERLRLGRPVTARSARTVRPVVERRGGWTIPIGAILTIGLGTAVFASWLPDDVEVTEPVAPAVEVVEPVEEVRISPMVQGILDRWRRDGREVPGGEYRVGVDDDVFGNPVRTVVLEAFEIGEHEVTCGEYMQFVEAGGPSPWEGGRYAEGEEDLPVVNVSFDDARAYCEWLGSLHPDLGGVRLPLEEEWEVAASWDRAGDRKFAYPWGDGWDPEKANVGTGKVRRVGASSFDRSSFGCEDMSGNVREWTTGPGGKPVIRGGCYLGGITPESFARCEWRLMRETDETFRRRRWVHTGFRVVLPGGFRAEMQDERIR